MAALPELQWHLHGSRWSSNAALPSFVLEKIVKVAWESNFGELLILADSALEKECVLKVVISTSERFIDPIHEVNIKAPILICDTFKC